MNLLKTKYRFDLVDKWFELAPRSQIQVPWATFPPYFFNTLENGTFGLRPSFFFFFYSISSF